MYDPLPLEAGVASAVGIDPGRLRRAVVELSFPRNAPTQPRADARAAELVDAALKSSGWKTARHGRHGNVLTRPPAPAPWIVVGAHYDSVPASPGADDNAGGVAAMPAAAKAPAHAAPKMPVRFAAFNGEEDGLAGSRDFAVRRGRVAYGVPAAPRVRAAALKGFRVTPPASPACPARA
jgi:acetylornithine deacetylase/succinyl-diaminopimelate desuccinylase-like protein